MSAIAAVLLTQAAPAVAQVPVPMPVGEEMTTRIETNDAQLFWGFFEGCDPDTVAPLLHPDFRMIHDLAGMPASSAEEFVGQARKNCDSRKPGQPNEGYKNRRLLVPGSRTIRKLGDLGGAGGGAPHFPRMAGRGPRLGPDRRRTLPAYLAVDA